MVHRDGMALTGRRVGGVIKAPQEQQEPLEPRSVSQFVGTPTPTAALCTFREKRVCLVHLVVMALLAQRG